MAAKERDDMDMGLRIAGPPRWYSDARVSHVIRGFDDALQLDANGSAPAGESGGFCSATAQLRRDYEDTVLGTCATLTETEQFKGRAHAIELVIEGIKTTLLAMLLVESSTINVVRTVLEHGVDSLIAAELRNWFYLALGSKISMLDLLNSDTSISTLAAKVADIIIKEKKANKK